MEKDYKKLIKDAESYLIVSNHGMVIEGSKTQILSLITMASHALIKETDLTKDLIKEAVDLAEKDPTEMLKMILEEIKDTLTKFKEEEE